VELVKDTLKPLNVPVAFLFYNGTATTYITFSVYDESGRLFADNDEQATYYDIKVNIWSKTDFKVLADSIKVAMKNAGFSRMSGIDGYNQNATIFQKQFRFFYLDSQN
jgi:hypothetical protein